jgi:iron-sulfur cluster assembly protein
MAQDHIKGPAAVPAVTPVTLTEKAAKKLLELMKAEQKDPGKFGLRVGVIGGGCSGFQYMLDFDTKREGDLQFESFGAKVLVDDRSINYVKGAVVDYVESLMGAGFQVQNPNVKGSCGCGSSFNV